MGKNWEIGIDTYIPLCIKQVTNVHRASLVAQSVKNLPAMQEARVQSLGLLHCRQIFHHLSHQRSYYTHFTGEETEQLGNLPKVTQLASSRAGVQARTGWLVGVLLTVWASLPDDRVLKEPQRHG